MRTSPPRLIHRLASLFIQAAHVRDVGLKQASDFVIWDWAKTNGYTIVTTDADFADICGERGWPPKVVHLAECNFPLRTIESLLRKYAVRITEFQDDPDTGLLVLRRH